MNNEWRFWCRSFYEKSDCKKREREKFLPTMDRHCNDGLPTASASPSAAVADGGERHLHTYTSFVMMALYRIRSYYYTPQIVTTRGRNGTVYIMWHVRTVFNYSVLCISAIFFCTQLRAVVVVCGCVYAKVR